MTKIEMTGWQKEAAAQMDAAWRGGARGVYLMGSPGTGKTVMAQLFTKSLVTGTKRVGAYSWKRCVEFNCVRATLEAHASMNKTPEARTAWEMVEQATNADVVMLDDFGREHAQYGRGLVFSLLDQASGFIVITTNLSKKQATDLHGGDGGLRSRLAALQTITFPTEAQDFRRRK